MDVKRIGIIGLGDIAQKVYLPHLSSNAAVHVAGIMSRSAATVEQMKAMYRIPFGTTSLKELLDLHLDAVFIHSPTETHYAVAMECLRHGVAVYVDKPLSYDWEESKELASCAERKGILLGVGFNRRFAPMYLRAKQWMNKAGGFDWCSAVKHRTKLQSHSAAKTYYDDLIHMLDLLVWLGDGEHEVISHSQQVDNEGRLLHASGSLMFGSSIGSFSMVRLAGSDVEKLELHGNGRSAEVMNLENAVFYEKGSPPQVHSFGSWDSILDRRGFTGVIDHFLQSLDSPDACRIRADMVLPSHELVERLIR
jgi:virulence factor